jgi:hypothetical protein
MEITKHAYKRAKERLGLSKKALRRHVIKVEGQGLRHGDFSGSMKRYLDKEFLAHGKATDMRVYGHFLYIIHGEILITIVDVPTKFARYVDQVIASKEEENGNQ